MAFTLGELLQKDLNLFVADWNTHPIRRNRNAPTSPHGCPDDIYAMPTLYSKYFITYNKYISFTTGAQDQLQIIDSNLWATCMMEESKPMPKFYPDDFKRSAEIVLQSTLGFTREDINHENCRMVYLKLVDLIEALESRGIPICSEFQASDTESD